jgi:hypothetical protein
MPLPHLLQLYPPNEWNTSKFRVADASRKVEARASC